MTPALPTLAESYFAACVAFDAAPYDRSTYSGGMSSSLTKASLGLARGEAMRVLADAVVAEMGLGAKDTPK